MILGPGVRGRKAIVNGWSAGIGRGTVLAGEVTQLKITGQCPLTDGGFESSTIQAGNKRR